MVSSWRVALAFIIPLVPLASAARSEEDYRKPVHVIAANALPVNANGGSGFVPFFANRSLDSANPDVERAVIVIHGRLRNAGTYFQSALKALDVSGAERTRTVVIAPQFLADTDLEGRPHQAGLLNWEIDRWQGGDDAVAPAPISSFEALDAILARLADAALFPALKSVVIVGHSAGGQVVQRYAILGRGEETLRQKGIHLRYVVANPSSYAYFDASRPSAGDSFAPFPAASCPGFNRWKYGMEGLPRYAGAAAPSALEQAYSGRDVVYLLGTDDTDPHHRALDVSCMAEAEGPMRLARGKAYFAYLKSRHPSGLAHRLVFVPGVAHDGDRMLTSDCGMAVIFDRPGCGAS
jgi:pimeloyl-ACP methyl ester carboxylesterase